MDTRFEIVPDFYIGYTKTLHSVESNNICKIDTTINCEKDLSFMGKYKEYNNPDIKQRLILYEIDKIAEYLIECANIIYNSITQNKAIMVCCDDCNQKSPTIALVYLMKYGKLDVQSAIDIIKSKKPDVFYPKIEFSLPIKKLGNKII